MRYGAAAEMKPQWLLVGSGLVIVVATYLFLIVTGSSGLSETGVANTTALIAYAGYLIGAGLIVWGVSRQFTTLTYALIPIAIAINIALGQIVGTLRIPLYLDSIGTVLVGVLAGPWAGAVAGALTNIIWGLTLNPILMPFAIVALVIGLLAGWFARLGWFRRFYLIPIAGLITGLIAALLSAPLSAFIFGGVTGAGADALVAAFRAYGSSILGATTLQGLSQDPLDKLVSFVIAYLIVVALPARLRAQFSRTTTAATALPR